MIFLDHENQCSCSLVRGRSFVSIYLIILALKLSCLLNIPSPETKLLD